jgi:hypothetical protein
MTEEQQVLELRHPNIWYTADLDTIALNALTHDVAMV